MHQKKLIDEIGKICQQQHYSLVTVESCTGGGLAFAIANHPGASSILERSYIVYSNAAKHDVLEISDHDLQIHGLVSKEIAIKMAEQGLEKSNAQISIATTGVEEESSSVPGIMWVACAGKSKKTTTTLFTIKGNRAQFSKKAIEDALQTLLKYIQ